MHLWAKHERQKGGTWVGGRLREILVGLDRRNLRASDCVESPAPLHHAAFFGGSKQPAMDRRSFDKSESFPFVSIASSMRISHHRLGWGGYWQLELVARWRR